MSSSSSDLQSLYLGGVWRELLDRAAVDNTPETALLRARALIAMGRVAAVDGGEALSNLSDASAGEVLQPLIDAAGDLSVEARAELVYARYIGSVLHGTNRDLTPDAAAAMADIAAPGSSAMFRARLTAGLIALRARAFERSGAELARAGLLVADTGDGSRKAELDFALGRLAAWQGRARDALRHLQAAAEYWKGRGNELLAAHAAYELGVMHVDRREWQTAGELLRAVVAAYERSGTSTAYLDRARQKLASALIGAGELDAAEAILRPLQATVDQYRYAMVQRDLAALHLERAVGAKARGDVAREAFLTARRHSEEASRRTADLGPTDFAVLSLRQLEAQLIIADPAGQTTEALTTAGDMLARIAEAFSAVNSERTHEVGVRIDAMKAYLAAASVPGVDDVRKVSLLSAARTEAQRLTSAAASIEFQLDEASMALVRQASLHGVAGDIAEPGEEALLHFMRRSSRPADRLETLARLAEALGRFHDMGASPTGFGPSDVVVRHPASPAIRTYGGPCALRHAVRAADRPFAAPEMLRDGQPDAAADLYVLGALLIVWFGERLPANEGRPLLWVRRALRGRPLKKWGGQVSGLALELTSLSPASRSLTAYDLADRLRQAKRSIPANLDLEGG